MAAASGIISRVSIKETTPDNYGNDKLKSFQLEGDERWFGLGKSKGDQINVKKGKDYVGLSVGDEIEFFYEESEYNGKTYFNAKSSGIKLVAKGTGAPAKAAASAPASSKLPPAPPKPAGGSTTGAKPPYEAGIKVGHAINNAVQLVCAEEGPITLAAIEKKAIAILKLSRKMEQNFEAIFDNSYPVMGGEVQHSDPIPEPQPEPEPEPQPEPEPPKKSTPSIADFDDDIPF